MLTVQGLVEEMGLDLVAGREGAGAPIRWVHASELPDPTPWLSGGELILTTGIGLPADDAGLRAFVAELAEVGVVGLFVELGRRYSGSLPRESRVQRIRRRRRRSQDGSHLAYKPLWPRESESTSSATRVERHG